MTAGNSTTYDSGLGGDGSTSPGSPKPWLGSDAGLNLATGNKLTAIPIVGWKGRGGLSVNLSLYHNSQGDVSSPLAVCWTMSYESQVTFDSSGNATITWDNGSVITFTKSGSTYIAPTGEHGKFSQTSGNEYEYISTGQGHYVFTANLSGYLTKIYDPNGNTINISRPSNVPYQIAFVDDPTSRSLFYSWNGNKLRRVTDELGRFWTFNYSGLSDIGYQPSGSTNFYQAAYQGYLLQSVTLPIRSGQTTASQIAFSYSQYTTPGIDHHFTYYDGTIQTITDPLGHPTTFAYDTSGNKTLTQVTDAANISTTFSYATGTTSGSGSTTVTDANGHSGTKYYVGGKLDHVVNALGQTVAAYVYGASNNVSQVTDGRGFSWLSSYDATGTNLTSSQDPDGHTASMTYNAFNEPLTVTDALNHTATITYDALGNFTSATDPLNHTNTITVPTGNHGLPTSAQDALGNPVTINAYDANGNVTQATDSNGVTGYASYNVLNWKQSVTDMLGNTTVYHYDDWGRVLTVQRGGAQQQPLYRLDGKAGCVNGGTNTSDDLNRVFTADSAFLTSMLAGGWQSEGTSGYLYLSANAKPGLVALHRVQSSASGGENVYCSNAADVNYYVGLGWTDAGVVGYVFPPSVSNTANLIPLYKAYNTSTNRVLFTNEYWEYTNLVSPWQKQGIVCYLQGQAGSLLTVATYVYDDDNNVKSVRDANDNGFDAIYDANNRMTSRTNTRHNGGNSGGGINDTVTYTYDQPNAVTNNTQLGLLSWTTNARNATTTYTYDALNRVIKRQYPDGMTSQVTQFDGNGNPTLIVNGNGVTRALTYDKENRLIGNGFPSPSGNPQLSFNKAYAYDAAGRLIGMSDVTGSTGWTYDAADRLTQIATAQGTVNYGYDAANRLTSRSASNVSGSWTYSYGAYNGATSGTRLVSEKSPFNETSYFAYDAAGRLSYTALGNNVNESYFYDDQGRVTDISSVPNTGSVVPFSEYHYAYDAGGRIVSKRRGSDGQIANYTYDGSNQLVEENVGYNGTTAWYDQQFSYDANGNRLTRKLTVGGNSASALTDTFTYDIGDKLTSVSGGALGTRTYGYDSRGSLLSVTQDGHPAYALTYDWDGRSICQAPYVNTPGVGWNANPSNGSVWTNNAYNGFGLRVQKYDGTGSFGYLTDGSDPGSQVLTDGSAVYTDGLSERRGGSSTSGSSGSNAASKFYSGDLLGSVGEITDSSGTSVTDVNAFDAFGNTMYHAGSTPTPFGFAGQAGYQSDTNSGLQLLGNRFYDPSIGRFLSRDPIGAGDNWYAYCGDDPVDAIDPEGLDPLPITLPGRTIWLDPKTLIAGRATLETGKVNGSYRLYQQGQYPPEPITVNTQGIIEQGNSRARAAAQLGKPIQAIVVDRPGTNYGLITEVGFNNGPPVWENPGILSRIGRFIGGLFRGPRSPGSGGGIGAFGTIAVGMGALQQGVSTVVPYRRTLNDLSRPDFGDNPNDGHDMY